MHRTLVLLVLSVLNLLAVGLVGSNTVEGLTSIENIKFYEPSQSELKHLLQIHDAAIQTKSKNKAKPKFTSTKFRHLNVTKHEIFAAKKLVDTAAEEQSIYNEWIINNPLKNNYREEYTPLLSTRRNGVHYVPPFYSSNFDRNYAHL